MKKLLLLSHVCCRPERVLRAAADENGQVKWMFLGQDHLAFLRWNQALRDRFLLVRYNENLLEIALSLKKDFLKIIADFGGRLNSPAWWAMRISERNTAISPLFLYCCYLFVAAEYLLKSHGTCCLVSESRAVLNTLSIIAEQSGWHVEKHYRSSWLRNKLFFWAIIAARVLIMIGKAVSGRIFGPPLAKRKGEQKAVLIHTYVDETCFGGDGAFHDRYFPGLHEWLKMRGFEVIIIPVLYNIKRSYVSALKWFKESRACFINPHRYYRPADYVFALGESWRQLFLMDSPIFMRGMDVTAVFKEELERTVFSGLEPILYFRLPKRLEERGCKIHVVIAEYENMIHEKLLISGFRRYMPSAAIVGFQHGALYPLLLCNFITKEEVGFAPLPDRIVCNGEFFLKVLVDEGLPSERAVVGPALRYAHLWKEWRQDKADALFHILAPIPLMTGDAVELLTKLVDAFGNREELKVAIKPHPMSAFESILKAGSINKIPPNFHLVQGSIDEWLGQCKIVVSMSSSSLYEAMAAGLPVIVVGREGALDLNPLGFYRDFNMVFYSPDQIYREAMRMLSLSHEDLYQYRLKSKEILHSSFTPVTEEGMKVFVEGLHPADSKTFCIGWTEEKKDMAPDKENGG